MKKRVKRKSKPNINKIINSDNLINSDRRSKPMAPKAGPTLYPRRYKYGGKYD